jgi:hypothetical protein
MTTHPPENVRAFKAIGVQHFIGRIYEDLSNRIVRPEEFVRWQEAPDSSMRRLVAEGVLIWEVHNEPNLIQEGQGKSWNGGASFADWFIEVRRRLKLAFPQCLIGFPGLSPGGDIQGVRVNSDAFLRDAQRALDDADWVAAHAYEVFDAQNRGAGGAWRSVRERAPNKPLAVTEFSSPLQLPQTQATQYRKYYEALRNESNLFGAYSYCSYGDSFQHESWRTKAGHLTAIPFEVAKRQYGTVPPPIVIPPNIPWLPEPHEVVIVDSKYGGATIRYLDGTEFKFVMPGVELARRSAPFDIPSLPSSKGKNRVMVNRQLGLHVLSDRLIAPYIPDATFGIFAWPTDYEVVTQDWAARPEYYAQWSLAGHEGLDIRGPFGSNVYAVYDGEVIQVSSGGNYGNQVRIKHIVNGLEIVTVYAHLKESAVAKGDIVTKRQLIGEADNTGNSDGSHLHFGVRPASGGTPGFSGFVDPGPWLGV